VKEVTYHARFANEWMVRLGDGTAESHARAAAALEWMWRFVDEMFADDSEMQSLVASGIAVNAGELRAEWDRRVNQVLADATLELPKPRRAAMGGRVGHHSEHLGHLLTEMQFLPRAYPGATW
jgi:ring-1,2-phenylacetyl-CoA epoxidase subunit PaaC